VHGILDRIPTKLCGEAGESRKKNSALGRGSTREKSRGERKKDLGGGPEWMQLLLGTVNGMAEVIISSGGKPGLLNVLPRSKTSSWM